MAKRRVSANRAVKEIFDPVLKTEGTQEAPKKKEKNVFFREKARIVIVQPTLPPPAASGETRRPAGSFLPVFLFLVVFALLLGLVLYGVNLFFELEVGTPALKPLLRAKAKQVRALEAQFEQELKEEAALRRSVGLQEEERKSVVSNLRILRKRFSQGGEGGSDLLWELARLTPPKIWFQEFSVDSGRVTVRGFCLERNAVRGFLKSLAGSSYFENPRLLSFKGAEYPSPSYFTFEIKADVAR